MHQNQWDEEYTVSQVTNHHIADLPLSSVDSLHCWRKGSTVPLGLEVYISLLLTTHVVSVVFNFVDVGEVLIASYMLGT